MAPNDRGRRTWEGRVAALAVPQSRPHIHPTPARADCDLSREGQIEAAAVGVLDG